VNVEPPILRNLLLFGHALRAAGIPVSPVQLRAFAEALQWIDLGQRDQVFHTARSLLVHRREDLALFETIFHRFWRAPGAASAPPSRKMPPDPRRRPRERGSAEVLSFLVNRREVPDREVELTDRSRAFSSSEALQRKDFSDMTEEEMAAVRRLIAETRWKASLRRTRRLTPDSRGSRLHLRRMMRESARHGGVMVELAHLSRKIKQRPVVLMADISGSMEKYSRVMLQFFFGVSHSLQRVECFVFGTRLSRITPQLRLRNIDRALASASAEVVDWSGGTRIGESLRDFNRHWSRRVLRRGAVVIVVSDGWERGSAEVLRREMRYLAHRCHRLIWLNPHLASAGYEHLVEGMSTALPFIDDFLPVHNLESLRALSEHLASLPVRRSVRATPPSAGWVRRKENRG
jgi:uncharacterized protein with von Willebrand factor type A (vWA) domain